MNLKKIKSFEKKVQREAQKAVDAVYKKYNKQMIALIAEQLPKGKSLGNGNGLAIIDENLLGKAWGITNRSHYNKQLNYIASLQYATEHNAGFNLPQEIKSTKIN